MAYESAILVKVDRNTKKKMDELSINWSEEIRIFIKKRLDSETGKNLALAVALTDKLFRKAKAKNYDSTAFIRRMRGERYGPSSH